MVLSFQLCSVVNSGDPFPQCAHWGLPLKGAAPCGARGRAHRPRQRPAGRGDLGSGAWSTPLAPLLGELSSDSETEGSPGLWECQWGKELSGCVLSFPFCSVSESGDPFPQCAHWGLPLRGAAPCGVRERAHCSLTTPPLPYPSSGFQSRAGAGSFILGAIGRDIQAYLHSSAT